MKKKHKLLLPLFLLAGILNGCTSGFTPFEGRLYSEKAIYGQETSNPEQDYSVLTRGAAIEKALYIFDKSLNIKIDRSQFTESVKLVRADPEDNLQWQITWCKTTSKTIYACTLDSANGDVLEIQATNIKSPSNPKSYQITPEEIKLIIGPLLECLKIEINDYSIIIPAQTEKRPLEYGTVTLVDSEKRKAYSIGIDFTNKIITSFIKIGRPLKSMEQEKKTYETNINR